MPESTHIVKRVVEFSKRPGPRFINQGKDSGEQFYSQCLKPWFDEAITSNRPLTVVLDGTDGYLSSFIDEAFGRLVYEYGRGKVEEVLTVKSELEPVWLEKLQKKVYPAWQLRKEQGLAPKITVEAV